MITIKSNAYSDAEKIAIHDALQAAVNEFGKTRCKASRTCSNCEYRHACYDLNKALEYALKLRIEVIEK